MSEKVGVYICHCGSNIAGKIDVVALAEWAGKNLEGVVISREYKFMCSDVAHKMIEDDIKEHGLTRIVVGACSPHLHEKTFRRVATNAGLNPYLVQMANLREHISWVIEDEEMALEKAKAVMAAAVRRVQLHEELEPARFPVTSDTLVVGGGIAGIQAALELANGGNHVYLVERSPSIGGHMAQFDKTFPTLDCSACILTPRMSEVGNHENITLLSYSEVEEVSGFVGNFDVKVRKKARYINEDDCTACGICIEKCPKKVLDTEFDVGLAYRRSMYRPFPQAVPAFPVLEAETCTYFQNGKCKACEKFCPTGAINFEQEDTILDLKVGNIILATGFDLFDSKKIPQYGYGRLENVFTSLEFERMCNAAGPTEGKILLRDGKTEPQSVAIVHCVGSRDENHNIYCSSICCMAALKFGHLVREKTPAASVHSFYIDMRSPQKGYEEFYHRLLEEGMIFVRGKVAEITDAARTPEEQGKLIVQVEDTLIQKQRRIPVDMVILMAAIEPRADARDVGLKFGISCSMEGWFTERHPKLDPVATMTDGIYIAGVVQGPKDIPASVGQGAAAAARVQGLINVGTVEIEPIVASINEERCSGCRLCNALCPYNAIEYIEDEGVSRITSALCKGCGTCVSACPAQAISGAHFNNQQIIAELEGLLYDVFSSNGGKAPKAEPAKVSGG